MYIRIYRSLTNLNLGSLTTLNLAGNALSTLPAGAFSGLTRKRTLTEYNTSFDGLLSAQERILAFSRAEFGNEIQMVRNLALAASSGKLTQKERSNLLCLGLSWIKMATLFWQTWAMVADVTRLCIVDYCPLQSLPVLIQRRTGNVLLLLPLVV